MKTHKVTFDISLDNMEVLEKLAWLAGETKQTVIRVILATKLLNTMTEADIKQMKKELENKKKKAKQDREMDKKNFI